MNFIDLKMTYNDDKCYFDLQVTKNGDLQYDNSFDTSMNCALLTDGRADKSEVNILERQRGTIVDVFTTKRNGSKLWLLEQSRLDLTAKNRAMDYCNNALSFLSELGYCKAITTTSKLRINGIELSIIIERMNGVFDKYAFNTWENSIYKV